MTNGPIKDLKNQDPDPCKPESDGNGFGFKPDEGL